MLSLREAGVTEPAVLKAIETTPRDLFVPELFKTRSFEDSALPIACGQTISQPQIVGLMSQALTAEPRHRVLEIGTGSGYQTAVLSKLVRYVYTVERYRTLLGEAEARLKRLGVQNVISRFGDGGEGWPEQAPFDRVLVTAAAPGTPEALLKQLKPAGVLVAPIGRGPVQQLIRFVGDGAGASARSGWGKCALCRCSPGWRKSPARSNPSESGGGHFGGGVRASAMRPAGLAVISATVLTAALSLALASADAAAAVSRKPPLRGRHRAEASAAESKSTHKGRHERAEARSPRKQAAREDDRPCSRWSCAITAARWSSPRAAPRPAAARRARPPSCCPPRRVSPRACRPRRPRPSAAGRWCWRTGRRWPTWPPAPASPHATSPS